MLPSQYGMILLAALLAISLVSAAVSAQAVSSTSAPGASLSTASSSSSSAIAVLVNWPSPGSPVAKLVDGPMPQNNTSFCVNSPYPVCGGQCGRVKPECTSFNEKTRLGFADTAQKCGCDCQAVNTTTLSVNESVSWGDFTISILGIERGVAFSLIGSDGTSIVNTSLAYPVPYSKYDPATGRSIAFRFTSIANGRVSVRIYPECPAGQYYDFKTCKCTNSTVRLASAGSPDQQIRANVTLPPCFDNCYVGSTYNASGCYCWPPYTPKPPVRVPGSISYIPQPPGSSIITSTPDTTTTPGTPPGTGTGTTPGTDTGTGTGGTTPGTKNGTTIDTGTGTTPGTDTGTGTGGTTPGSDTGTGTTPSKPPPSTTTNTSSSGSTSTTTNPSPGLTTSTTGAIMPPPPPPKNTSSTGVIPP